jgi:hypothetical protein
MTDYIELISNDQLTPAIVDFSKQSKYDDHSEIKFNPPIDGVFLVSKVTINIARAYNFPAKKLDFKLVNENGIAVIFNNEKTYDYCPDFIKKPGQQVNFTSS